VPRTENPRIPSSRTMTAIRQEDLIESVADALQYISYFHPMDYIRALGEAYRIEQSPAARDAIAQILTNSKMCAEGKRPICQDTGIVVAFLRIGMGVRWEDATMSIADMVNECVHPSWPILPAGERTRKTTRRPSSTWKSSRAIRSK
jgi:fumarate hydratase class I